MKRVAEAKKQGLLTELEAKSMDWLLEEGYYAEKHFSDVWVENLAEGINESVNVTRGVVSNLVKKGYIYVEAFNDGEKPFVFATEKGYELDDEYETKYKGWD